MSCGWAGGWGGMPVLVQGFLISVVSRKAEKTCIEKASSLYSCTVPIILLHLYIRSHVFLITGHFLRLFSGIKSRRKGDKSLF
jgi:hypothetical protein